MGRGVGAAGFDHGEYRLRERETCALTPRKYERHESRNGGVSGGLGRGAPGFWTKVRIGQHPNGCWQWIGYVTRDGGGKFTTTVAGKQVTRRAHRYAYEIEHGPIPRGMNAIHTCGNVACVRPDHMTLATPEATGARFGGTGKPADHGGEMHSRTKLRNDDVLFIRSQQPAYGLAPVLARLFDVKPQVIHCIRSRKTWKHLGNGNRQNAMPIAQLRALVEQREEKATLDSFAEQRTE